MRQAREAARKVSSRARRSALRGKLLMRYRDMMGRMGGEEEALAPCRCSDPADMAEESVRHEVVAVVNDIRSEALARLEEALNKVQEGTYGVCEECGHRIPQSRLALMPGATLCVKCQREMERTEADLGEGASIWDRLGSVVPRDGARAAMPSQSGRRF